MPWFDCAVRRPINANTGGIIGTNLGLVLHHAVMNGSGWHFFNSPSAKVSAHFWVLQNGTIEQYVDTNVVAWHGKSLNSRYVGVETEGCTSPANGHADAMSEAMVAALARLYAEGMRRHGWANALASRDGDRGFGFHRMAVATGCPCDVRLNRRQEILSRAAGGAPGPGPTPPPTIGDDDLTPDQDSILRQIYNMLTNGRPAHDKPPSYLHTRLVSGGAPDGNQTGFGTLTTLDSLSRMNFNEIKAIQARLDRIEAKLQ